MVDTKRALELAQEIERHDGAMVPAPWIWTDEVLLWNEEADHCVLAHEGPRWPVTAEHRAGIAYLRNSAPETAALLRQLVDALAQAERERDSALIRSAELAHTAGQVEGMLEGAEFIKREVASLRAELQAVTADRDALGAEVEAMRPVVEAAVANACHNSPYSEIVEAVQEYRNRSPK